MATATVAKRLAATVLLTLSVVLAGRAQIAAWACSEGTEVKQDQQAHWSRYIFADNAVWNGTTIAVHGARNEVVAFQVIVSSGTSQQTDISVSLDELATNGYTIENSSADPLQYVGRNIEIFVEHYVEWTACLSASGDSPIQSSVVPDDSVWDGFRADALIPIEAPSGTYDHGQGGCPVTIAAGKVQGFWVDVYIPKDAPAGLYAGNFLVKKSGSTVATLPVVLDVYDFTLDDSPRLRTFHRGFWNSLAAFGIPYGTANDTLYHRYKMLMHRHRTSFLLDVPLDSVVSTSPSGYGQYLTGDGYRADHPLGGYAGPGTETGDAIHMVGMFAYPHGGSFGTTESSWRTASDGWVNFFETYAPNCLYFKYLFDEPENNWSSEYGSLPLAYADIMTKVSWLKNNPGDGVRMKAFLTSRLDIEDPAREWPSLYKGGVDGFGLTGKTAIWEGYHVRASGDTVSKTMEDAREGLPSDYSSELVPRYTIPYNGERPWYPHYPAGDMPFTEARAVAWVLWKYGASGYFHWEVQYNMEKRQPWYYEWRVTTHPEWGYGTDDVKNPWADPAAFGASMLYSGQEVSLGAYDDWPSVEIPSFPGDSRKYRGPIASIRLKNFRRSLQDYEYISMAQQVAGGGPVSAIVNNIVPAAFDDRTTSWDPNLPPDYPTYEHNDKVFDDARQALAAMIASPASPPTSATTLVSPSNGAYTPQPVTLKWRAVTGATRYWLMVSTDNWQTLRINNTAITDTQMVVTGLPFETECVWTITPGNGAGWGPETSSWHFTTYEAPPSGQTITLDWNKLASSEVLADDATVVNQNLQRLSYWLVIKNPLGKTVVSWPSEVHWPDLASPPQPQAGDTSVYFFLRDSAGVLGYVFSNTTLGSAATMAWVQSLLTHYLRNDRDIRISGDQEWRRIVLHESSFGDSVVITIDNGVLRFWDYEAGWKSLADLAGGGAGGGYDGQNADSLQGKPFSAYRPDVPMLAILYDKDSSGYVHRTVKRFDTTGAPGKTATTGKLWYDPTTGTVKVGTDQAPDTATAGIGLVTKNMAFSYMTSQYVPKWDGEKYVNSVIKFESTDSMIVGADNVNRSYTFWIGPLGRLRIMRTAAVGLEFRSNTAENGLYTWGKAFRIGTTDNYNVEFYRNYTQTGYISSTNLLVWLYGVTFPGGTITGTLNTYNLLPNATRIRDVGSSSYRYHIGYFGHVDTDSLTWTRMPVTLYVPISDETTALTASTSTAKVSFRMPHAMTVTSVRANVRTAPTGSAMLFDIHEAGTTILSTKLMIDATEYTSTTATTGYVLSDASLADDAEITLFIDQIGSTVAGAGAKIEIIGTRSIAP